MLLGLVSIWQKPTAAPPPPPPPPPVTIGLPGPAGFGGVFGGKPRRKKKPPRWPDEELDYEEEIEEILAMLGIDL